MKHLKRLALSFTLMSVLAVTAFAGETLNAALRARRNKSTAVHLSVRE